MVFPYTIYHTPSTIPSSPPKHLIILINPRLVFQREFLPHRKISHLIHVQDPPQVGMTDEIDPEKIIGLPFHPVGRLIKLGSCKHVGFFDGSKDLETDAYIINQVMQVVDHGEFAAGLARIVNGSEVREELKTQLRVVVKKLEHLKIHVLWNFKGEHAIGFVYIQERIPEFFLQSLSDQCVVQSNLFYTIALHELAVFFTVSSSQRFFSHQILDAHESVENSFRAGRTARHVNIHRNNLIDTL